LITSFFSFYSVLQISQLNLTFKEIIYNYRKQPQSKPQVFRSVFVDWSLARRNGLSRQRTGQEHIDIISFYNEVFIPSVKPLLVELGPGGATMRSDQPPEANNKNDGTCLFRKLLSIIYLLHSPASVKYVLYSLQAI
jgi:retinoblastoma-like protein 1